MKRIAPLLALLPLSACSAPLSYLDATSPIAGNIASLGWGLTLIAVSVCIIIAILLAIALTRHREPSDADISPVNDRGPIRLIGVGVAVSVVILMISAVWTLVVAGAVGLPPGGNVLTVNVTGHEWWWEVEYQSNDPTRIFATANQLVIPAGAPVRVNLASADVIHSFWVPKLGGKMDMIPSRTNVTWLVADKIGEYRGQCSEFCGLQHANMAFNVRVVSKQDFDSWWNTQLQPAPANDPRLRTFMTRCAACHTIRGTDAGGIVGPDLSHFGSRESIAAGLMANTPANLAAWINNTQMIKPGAKMPELHMLASEVDDVTAYLEGLK